MYGSFATFNVSMWWRCDGDVIFLWGFLWELNTARTRKGLREKKVCKSQAQDAARWTVELYSQALAWCADGKERHSAWRWLAVTVSMSMPLPAGGRLNRNETHCGPWGMPIKSNPLLTFSLVMFGEGSHHNFTKRRMYIWSIKWSLFVKLFQGWV